MFEKMCLSFMLMCSVAMAASVGAINAEFKSLLHNDGIMEKNTLVLKNGPMIEASGDLIITGVLVSTLDSTYFYPDTNLKNVLFNVNEVLNCKSNCGAIKPSVNYPIEVLADESLISKTLGERIYGSQALRVKAHFNKFGYEADSSYLVLKDVFALTPIRKSYMTYNANDNEFAEEFGYGSKDDYVNVRKAPKGAIVGQIQKADMQKPANQKGIIVCKAKIFEGCNEINGWYEIFYFPAGSRDGKDAMHGYIHKSQLKL